VTCDERQDLILLYAMDALDAPQREEVRAHLAGGCTRCAGALSEAQGVVASLAVSAEPVTAPARARERLLDRVRAPAAGAAAAPSVTAVVDDDDAERAPTGAIPWTPEEQAAVSLSPPPPQRRAARRWLGPSLAAAACVGALIGSLAMWFAQRDRARLPGAPEVHMVALTGGESQPLARGRIFRDTVRHVWHVYVFDLKPPANGRTYELWFIAGDQKKIPAGTFDVDAQGKGTLLVTIADNLPPIVAAAITDEPLGGSPQPTGAIHLSGAIQ
jgi:anti-sigma-K factor RskA